jgi:hypothetical protein
MRIALLLAFATFPLAACSDALDFGTSDADTTEPDSGGGSHQAPGDAGGTFFNSDTGTGATSDATSPSSDAGAGTLDAIALETGTADGKAHDAGGGDDVTDASLSDTGPIVLGESCTAPIDISLGGTFAIDTCTLTDSVTASCGTTAAAAILAGVAPTTGSTYSITFPTGWVLQELDDTCSPESFSCGSTGTWGVSGDTPGGYWYFAIEPESGTCGSTTVTVDRVM